MDEKKPRKLFEILAIEKDLLNQTAEAAKQTVQRFGNTESFLGVTNVVVKLQEDLPDEPSQSKTLPGNVEGALSEYLQRAGRYLDVTIEKENSNTAAFADVILDGETFLERWSATALLNLEARLEELHKVYSAIPTLLDGEDWTFDTSRDCFVSGKREQIRNTKTQKVIVLYEATKEHPAQTQLVSLDLPAYKVERVIYSGALTLADKKARLDRIEALTRAVKQARQRANTVETQPKEVAVKIFKYINGK